MLTIGLLTLHLQIEYARSLKDKRQVVRSLKDRLRGRFNVAVAEVDHQESWQRSTVVVVSVSGTQERVEQVLRRAEAEAERQLAGHLTSSELEFI